VVQGVAAYLEQVGVKVKLREHPEWSEYFAESDKRIYGFNLIGWYDVPEPDNFMRAMLVSSTYSRGDFTPKMAELADAAIRTYDLEERCAAYREMQQLFHDGADRIPLAHSQYVDAIAKGVTGFELGASGSEVLRALAVER
jgi:ABC-type transport system substrate-binding protein